jgi:hypothetical protein
VPFAKAEKRKAYMREYMRERYRREKAFVWEVRLREERAMLRKALKRVAVAERWKSEHPEEEIDERWLSLAFVWNQVAAEEEEKAKNLKRVGV